jgi:hypothetical protein
VASCPTSSVHVRTCPHAPKGMQACLDPNAAQSAGMLHAPIKLSKLGNTCPPSTSHARAASTTPANLRASAPKPSRPSPHRSACPSRRPRQRVSAATLHQPTNERGFLHSGSRARSAPALLRPHPLPCFPRNTHFVPQKALFYFLQNTCPMSTEVASSRKFQHQGAGTMPVDRSVAPLRPPPRARPRFTPAVLLGPPCAPCGWLRPPCTRRTCDPACRTQSKSGWGWAPPELGGDRRLGGRCPGRCPSCLS